MTTHLCDLAFKYGSDKCRALCHPYTEYYYQKFLPRQNWIKKVLEFGIGCPANMWTKQNVPQYTTGASLHMWYDFFPGAQIYGADILPETQIKSDRITTFLCDERNPTAIKDLINSTGQDIDVVIDDASHRVTDQIRLAKTLLPLLSQKVVYIIEDVEYVDQIRKSLPDYRLDIVAFIPNRCYEKLVVINKV